MQLDKSFQIISYAAMICGFLGLAFAGAVGNAAGLAFSAAVFTAWLLEGSRRQIGERLGTALIVSVIPFFYIASKAGVIEYSTAPVALGASLGRIILTITAIKLLQRKSDRDWIFLYVMSFFEILLAAGLSISAVYFATFLIYVFLAVLAVIILEIRSARRKRPTEREQADDGVPQRTVRIGFRLIGWPSAGLTLLIALIAAPIFFLLPRVGAAGGGGGQAGVSTFSGFSDTVRLGQIGRIQQSDQVVMRIRVDRKDIDASSVKWRGIALDTFDNLSWNKSNTGTESKTAVAGDAVQLDYASGSDSLAVQTFYMEPLDTPVLFAMPRALAAQGSFSAIFRDKFGSLSLGRAFERTTYRVVSDVRKPSIETLRADRSPYSTEFSNYLSLPRDLDPRISELAKTITNQSSNRYDSAVALESYLSTNFGYTLEMRSGGPQPLADFLFRVREGHCEYFSTALAVMLRTRGIASRVVNGFGPGEYNETADMFVVRQKNAHSWVEVYFPAEKGWVAFDATPSDGREDGVQSTAFVGRVSRFFDAFEALWIEYFVAYDRQEQRSFFAAAKQRVAATQKTASTAGNEIKTLLSRWWSRVRGESGRRVQLATAGRTLLYTVGLVLLVALLVRTLRRIVNLRFWQRLADRTDRRAGGSVTRFYQRLQSALEAKGFRREVHQTPREFAESSGVYEAILIVELYNRVRFGNRDLTPDEERDIESWLETIIA